MPMALDRLGSECRCWTDNCRVRARLARTGVQKNRIAAQPSSSLNSIPG